MQPSSRPSASSKRQQSKREAEKLAIDRDRLAVDQQKLDVDRVKIGVDVLTKEHKNRFDEVIFHSSRYHKQVNFIQLYVTVVGSFIAVLFSKDWEPVQKALSPEVVFSLKATLISVAFLISLYLFTNVMDALYAIYMNGRRLADIEAKVNRLVGQELLTWDSRIVPQLYSAERFFIGAWVRPNILVGLWSFTFFLGISIGLCVVAYALVRPFFYYFTPVALFFAAATLLNWILLHREGLRFIDSAVLGDTHSPDNISFLYLIVLANVFLGYLPMVLFSIRDGALCGPPHQFPFCNLFAVSVGDLLLLPFIAYYAIMFLRQWTWRQLGGPILLGVTASIAINYLLHRAWISDPWTGFMDIALGELSDAGAVHFVYSSAHMALILIFVVQLVSRLLKPVTATPDTPLYASRRVLVALAVFLSLGVVDAVRQHFGIHAGAVDGLPDAIWPSLLLPAAALFLLRLTYSRASQ